MPFGHALQCILQHIYDANLCFGPVHMAKYDIADKFYHVPVHCNDVPNLGIILPQVIGEDQLESSHDRIIFLSRKILFIGGVNKLIQLISPQGQLSLMYGWWIFD